MIVRWLVPAYLYKQSVHTCITSKLSDMNLDENRVVTWEGLASPA